MRKSDKIVRLVDRPAMEAQAAAWIARLDTGEASPADWAEFEAWKAQSSFHQQAVDRLSGLWSEMDQLSRYAPPDRGEGGDARRRPASRASQLAWGAAFAAAVAAAAVGLGIWSADFSPPAPDVFTTPVGAQRTIRLADGSIVQLNTASRLEVLYRHDRRDLRLVSGEAFFEVAPNTRRPFFVYAGDGVVRAVGTAFDVRVKPDDLKVTLTKGAVDISLLDGAEEPKLAGAHDLAGRRVARMVAQHGEAESATLAQGRLEIEELAASEAIRRLAWREGLLVFDGEPLEDVVAEVSRYTPVQIEIADARLRRMRVAGNFGAGEVEPMLEALQAGFGVRVTRVDATHVKLEAPLNPSDANRAEP